MARLLRDKVRVCLSRVPFDYPLCPYTFQLADHFTIGSEHAPRIRGTNHDLETDRIQDIQQALGQMCLSLKTIEAPGAMIVALPSSGRSSVFSMCFLKEVLDYDLPMDLGDDTDGVTLPDTYMDEVDMIGIGHIFDAAPCEPHSAFDMFGVYVIDFENVRLSDTGCQF